MEEKKENPRVLKKRAELENKEFLMKDGEWLKVMAYYTAHNCTIKYLSDNSILEKVVARSIEKRTLKKVINHVGEKWTMNDGNEIEIIVFVNWDNCTVQYIDGFIVENIKYSNIKTGGVKRFIDKVGQVFNNNEGYEMEILESPSYSNCTIRFNDVRRTTLKNVSYNHITLGSVTNPNHPTSQGRGFMGIGKHKSSIDGERTTMHQKWSDMMDRCYENKQVTYITCEVDERWWDFQVFGDWYEEYYIEGFELDKDILFKGNKVYSPETCRFVPKEINNLITIRQNHRGSLPLGVYECQGKFKVQISRGKGYQEPLGTFDIPEKGFYVYKEAKEEWIKVVANKWRGRITEDTYLALMNWIIAITD